MRLSATNLACGLAVAATLVATSRAQAPTSVTFAADKSGQINFVMPSQNVGCIYTPAGGTAIYKPADGGPELSCDRREPAYIRVVLTPKSNKVISNVGDQGCCGADNVFAYGKRWATGPFTCDSMEAGLTCKRADGRGFTLSRQGVQQF